MIYKEQSSVYFCLVIPCKFPSLNVDWETKRKNASEGEAWSSGSGAQGGCGGGGTGHSVLVFCMKHLHPINQGWFKCSVLLIQLLADMPRLFTGDVTSAWTPALHVETLESILSL